MKKILNILFFLTLFLLLPQKIYAACIDSELTRLTNEASKSKITYDYLGDNLFSITITDISLEIYVKEYPSDEYTPAFAFSPTGYSTIEDFIGGTTVTLNFYAGEETICGSYILRTVDLSLPEANSLYGQEICDGAEEYYLCKKFINSSDLTSKEIIEAIEKYKSDQEINPSEETEKKVNESVSTIMDKIVTFFFKHLNQIMITIAGLSIIGIIIILLIRRKKAII